MQQQSGGSAAYWGTLFGAHANDWAATWEGMAGWGIAVYQHVLDRTPIGRGTRVLDVGCGAGRFVRMAADRGAAVAGLDAATELVEIAAGRTPQGEFRVGDLEALPWPDGAFDVVTGFSVFQFAADKARALGEARRVSRGPIAIVIPSRVSRSGIAAVFKPMFGLFPPEALDVLKTRGMYALSEPGRLEEVIAAADLTIRDDDEIDSVVVFSDADSAERAYLAAGATVLAVQHSGEEAVRDALRTGLAPFTGSDGRVTLASSFRAVIAYG
jgi:SAM-dependent methyltransferase